MRVLQIRTCVLIAGSRQASFQMLDYARRAVRRAHERGYTVIVGDNPLGVDMAVVQEAAALQTPIIVAGIATAPRNGGCQHGEYVQVQGTYPDRDRWMCRKTDMGLFIWNGHSQGTKAGYDYMVAIGKPAWLLTYRRRVK